MLRKGDILMGEATVWKFISAVSQGRGHLSSGTPCQDKVFHHIHGDVAVIALADGAGSASLSHFGAERIVSDASCYIGEKFHDIVENNDAAGLKKDFLQTLLDSLHQLGNELNCSLQDMASTLLLAASDGQKYFLAHVGDGVIGYVKDSEIKVASSPDNGEFANSTVFVTSSEALTSMKFFRGNLNNISSFILMSDGAENSFYNKATKTLMPVLVDIVHRCAVFPEDTTRNQLQNSMDTVIRRKTADDCSLIMMVRKDESFSSFNDFREDIKYKLFQIPPKSSRAKTRLRYYDELLMTVNEIQKCSEGYAALTEIAKRFHLKPKYLRKRLTRLRLLDLLEEAGGKYRVLVDL